MDAEPREECVPLPWITGVELLEKPCEAEVIGIALALMANLAPVRTASSDQENLSVGHRLAPEFVSNHL